jgi:hypothetical protein
LGLVIHTAATWESLYSNYHDNAILQVHANGTTKYIGNKLHLILADLMLTQSGLGLLLAAHTTASADGATDNTGAGWLKNDRIYEGLGENKKQVNHYTYKYTSGITNTWSIPDEPMRWWRLWIHEDNGGLYYSTPENEIYPWGWKGY